MPLYFVQPPNARYPHRPERRVDLDESPFPTIMCEGVGDTFLGPYHLEDTGMRATPPIDPAKPPYRVPLMPEIAAMPQHALTHLSTFSGGGGTCLGFRMAGYRTLLANDCDPRAIACYRKNLSSPIDERPIQELTVAEVLRITGLKVGELDVFEGSPPCTSFSTAGKLSKDWGKKKEHAGVVQQNVEDLFFEWLRLMEGLQPRAFVAENVSGMVKGVAKGYFKIVLARMKAAGYRTQARVLDAQWLGVPQQRQRVIFVGIREDLNAEPRFPTPLPYRYSVREALPWLTDVRLGAHGFKPETVTRDGDPAPTVLSSGMGSFDYDVGARVEHQLFDGTVEDVTDRPVPPILASSKGGDKAPRVVQGGFAEGDSRADVTDTPARTIHAVHDGSDVPQVVEERVLMHGHGGYADLEDVTDQPAHGIRATHGTGGSGSPIVRVEQGGRGPQAMRREDVMDRPAKTICAHVKGSDHPRVVHDTKGLHGSAGDITDLPAPAITVGGEGGGQSNHFHVEQPKRLIHDTSSETGAQNLDVTDRPAPAITNGGERVAAASHFLVEGDGAGEGPTRTTRTPGQVSPRARKADVDGASPTVLASSSGFSDIDVQRRKLTILEVKRLCSFPDDYDLEPAGAYSHQWARLGNSVPPLMARAYAAAIRDVLLEIDAKASAGAAGA